MKSLYFCFLDVEDQEEDANESSSEMTEKKYGKTLTYSWSFCYQLFFKYFHYFETVLLTPQNVSFTKFTFLSLFVYCLFETISTKK